MYHFFILSKCPKIGQGECLVLKKAAQKTAIFKELLLALALLISNTAAGLASRLARGLALAASAVLSALAKILCFNSLDVFHINTSI